MLNSTMVPLKRSTVEKVVNKQVSVSVWNISTYSMSQTVRHVLSLDVVHTLK